MNSDKYYDPPDDEEENIDTEPQEGDYTTEDYVNWYQDGKLVLQTLEGANDKAALKAHMEKEQFYPNAWWISDHGNAHLLDLGNN